MRGLLLSGGMDSIALAWWKRPDVAITIDYGQRAAKAEIAAAKEVSFELSIRHEVIAIDCRSVGSGDMSEAGPLDVAPASEWWPYRNQLLVTLAAARGLSFGLREVWVGTVASDSTHADGRVEFYEALDRLVSLQEGAVRVSAPAIGFTTVELIRTSAIPRSILAWAHSCHVGDLACGQCRGCVKHYEVTSELYGQGY